MHLVSTSLLFFFFNDTATTEIYTLSLHDALPISGGIVQRSELRLRDAPRSEVSNSLDQGRRRSEEHTSELQSPCNLVCRLLLEKKKPRRQLTRHRTFPHVRTTHGSTGRRSRAVTD